MNGTDVNESVTDINESVRRIRAAYADIDKAQSNAMEAASIAADGRAPAWVKKVETEEHISEMAGSIADRLRGEPAEALTKAIKTARRISKSVGPDLPELSGPSGASDLMRTTSATLIGTYDALADLTGLSNEDGWRPGAFSEAGLRRIKEKVDATKPVSMGTADYEAQINASIGIDFYIGVAAHGLFISVLKDALGLVCVVGNAKKADDEVPERQKTLAEDLQAQAAAKKASQAAKAHVGKGTNQIASKPQPKPPVKPSSQSSPRAHSSDRGFVNLPDIAESPDNEDENDGLSL